MPIPFKSKLSYAWERASRRKHIYSRAFESTQGEAHTSSWMKASLVQGEQDAFVLHTHRHAKTKAFQTQHDKDRRGNVFTYKQALEQIEKYETEMNAKGELLAQKQPFRGRIKTKLAPV